MNCNNPAEKARTETLRETAEPVTMGGWYEHTDGTVGEYRWIDGRLVLARTSPGWGAVPSREDDLRASEAWDREAVARG
jgi:hypothetical protein